MVHHYFGCGGALGRLLEQVEQADVSLPPSVHMYSIRISHYFTVWPFALKTGQLKVSDAEVCSAKE